ncbi:MAG: ATP-binding cassette domain-containing protein [Eggerthellaceae bacterium]|nr:ATP-binding cassette domain-containing protein [Eggerthellaceae bacterium]
MPTEHTPTEQLRLEHVDVSLGDARVLADFSLAFPECGFVCITGPSGGGKTTLLKVIAGLIEPDNGTVSGIDKTRLAMMFAEDVLLDWLSVEENIALVVKDSSLVSSACSQALETVELSGYEKHYPVELSKGMQRRVALARALAFESDILLLDEPTVNLDNRLACAIMARIVELRKDRLTICVTHNPDLMQGFATHTYRFIGLPLTPTE